METCMDLKPQNQSVLQEAHPILKVEDTQAQLPGTTIFSKIDINSGFWLTKESGIGLKNLEITPFACIRFSLISNYLFSGRQHFSVYRVNTVQHLLSI